MANRANHYDAAFEEYLRQLRVPYVAVDETRRSLLDELSLKSPDYIVSPVAGGNWLIDIKGRKFPSGGEGQSRRWENWATRDDIESMLRWQRVLGEGFRAMLLFAYHISDLRWLCQFERRSRFEHRRQRYAFYGVWVADYRAKMAERSRQWETVCLRKRDFEELRFPLGRVLSEIDQDEESLHSGELVSVAGYRDPPMIGNGSLLAQAGGGESSATAEPAAAQEPASLPHGQFLLDYLLVVALIAGALYAVCRPPPRRFQNRQNRGLGITLL